MDRRENMIRLKKQGYSYAVIGALYGLSRQRVHQLISGYARNLKRLNRKNGYYWHIHNAIIQRDGNKCQKCGSNKYLIVHHIDGDNTNNEFMNLITLCNKCHLDLHRPNGKKNLTRNANKNPLKPTSEAQGRALKRFCVELIGRLRRALNN